MTARALRPADDHATCSCAWRVLLSGSGTTLQNLLDRIAAGALRAEIAVVIASRADAYGLERARRAGVPAVVVARKAHADVDGRSTTRCTPRSSPTPSTSSCWPDSSRSSNRAPATPAG